MAARVVEEWDALPEPPATRTALIATGQNFPDALAASSFASWGGFPFYLVSGATDPAELVATLTAAGIQQVAILGGEAAVPLEIEDAIADSGIVVADRFAGGSRYETAALLADTFGYNTDGVGVVAVTTGTNFPDALSGGAALGLWGVPMVLTRPTSLEPAARDFLTNWGPGIQYVEFLGGLGSVNASTRAAVRTAITDTWATGFSALSVPDASRYEPNVARPASPAGSSAVSRDAK